MAQDCSAVYKTVYRQMLADGLSDSASQNAAAQAMKGCLDKQNARPTTISQPFTNVSAGLAPDAGPILPPSRTR